MFTGIIEELGEIAAVRDGERAARLTVRAPHAVSDARPGDSIAVAGVCLTVVEADDVSFTADVMAETLAVSTLSAARAGDAVNIESAVRADGRLGGHIVQGHVDGTAALTSIDDGSRWRVLRFALPAELAPLVTRKGSVAVDGVSLTVSAVSDAVVPHPAVPHPAVPHPATHHDTDGWFEVSLIPETMTATTLGRLEIGDRVNIETDILARQVRRMLAFEEPARLAHGSQPAAQAEEVSL